MTHFAILHHEDFRKGSDLGYGFGLPGERGSAERADTQRALVLVGLLYDQYRVAGVIDAEDNDDAYAKTQNGMPGVAQHWDLRARSTSVGDLLYVGDDVPRLFLVVSIGFIEVEVPHLLIGLLDRMSALVAERA